MGYFHIMNMDNQEKAKNILIDTAKIFSKNRKSYENLNLSVVETRSLIEDQVVGNGKSLAKFFYSGMRKNGFKIEMSNPKQSILKLFELIQDDDTVNTEDVRLFITYINNLFLKEIYDAEKDLADTKMQYSFMEDNAGIVNEQLIELEMLQNKLEQANQDLVNSNNDLEKANDDLRQARVQLECLVSKLNISNQDKDSLLTLIGHDIKSPISGILGFSELLENDFNELNDEEKKEYMGYIRQSAMKLNDLVTELLQWGRLVRNLEVIKLEDQFNIKEVILDAYLIYEQKFKDKNIDFKFEGCDIGIKSSEYMLKTVIRNLLANAVKFTRRDGSVSVSYLKGEKMHIFKVSDNGVGMTDEDMVNIFIAAKAQTKYGTDGEKGNGLAIPICKQFIDKCGGNITVESEVGVGTTFTIELPIIEDNGRSE